MDIFISYLTFNAFFNSDKDVCTDFAALVPTTQLKKTVVVESKFEFNILTLSE